MKMNGNPRFVKHKQLRSSGKSTQKKFIVVMQSGAPLLGLAKSTVHNIIRKNDRELGYQRWLQ